MTSSRYAEITIKEGESLTFTFNEYPSTGYIWTDAHDDGITVEDVPYMEEEGDVEVDPEDLPIGGAIDKSFRVVAEKSGTYSVSFLNMRLWNKDVREQADFEITVTP